VSQTRTATTWGLHEAGVVTHTTDANCGMHCKKQSFYSVGGGSPSMLFYLVQDPLDKALHGKGKQT